MTDTMLDIYNRLQQIHVLLDDGDRRSLNDANLSSPQYHLLLHLDTKGGEKGLAVTELANLMICTRSNATRLVQRLEQQGLVKLTRGTEDRRVVRVALTPEGHASFVKAQELHRAAVKRRFSALPHAQLEVLADLTETFVKALESDLASQK
ncbi:MAG: MarR family transcriptional regulator [Anaerolineae bacterium]|nr:MarR family transcriptional regulator [Anaerolineae bacterium]